MAVFFDKHVQFPRPSAGVHIHHQVEWHNAHCILAVASKNETTDADGSVNFYLDEGDLVEDASIQRSVVVECMQCMQWHPDKKIVAIGWRSGEITTYNDHDKAFFEQSSIHRSPISVLRWNSKGTRLISADKSGLLSVWSIDSQGQLHPTPIHQHRLHSPVTHCAMLHPYTETNTSSSGSVLASFSWQKKSAAHLAQSVQDPIACFIATEDGALFFMNHSGICVERVRLDGPIHSLLLRDDMELMAVVTQNMGLTQFSVGYDGQTSQTMNAKLSAQNKASSIIWVADGILASCSAESTIRFWDFDKSENYVLEVQQPGEVFTCISYNKDKGVLAGGTSAGYVVMWKWNGGKGRQSPPGQSLEGPDKWEFLTTSVLAGTAMQIKWGSKKHLLVANCKSSVQILSEYTMNAHYNQQVSAVQVSPSELIVECHNTGLVLSVKTDLPIKGVFVTHEDVAVWSGKKLAVYAFSQDKALVRNAGSFSTETQCAVLYEHNVYTIEKGAINVRAFQGTVKQLLSFTDQEGSPVTLSVGGHFLVAGTDTDYIKMWDLTRREAKIHCSKCLLEDAPASSNRIISVQCNCNGSKISAITENADTQIRQLTLLDIDSDSVKLFSPTILLEQRQDTPQSNDLSPTSSPQHASLPELPKGSQAEQFSYLKELLGRHSMRHYWDPNEPKILVVESVTQSSQAVGDGLVVKKSSSFGMAGKGRKRKYSQASVLLVSLFVTQELNVLVSDVMPTDHNYNGLIGVSVPFFYVSQKGSGGRVSPKSSQPVSSPMSIALVTMRGYVGLEGSDQPTLHAVVEFGYHSTIGNMDEAFRAIKLIKSESVWESMARMCVKTQRLDVAAVCLGNMGSARAAKAVREAKKIPEPEARLAVLAVQLGMLEEAEDLYKRSNRYDLLNQFYQASGQWTKAIEVAELNDRMHLKTTYYNYGKHAEALGELTAAINCYEKSGTHQFEVPRMLLDDPLELENYVMKSKDRGVRKWWAEYLESMGEWEQAMQFYETAKDYYSLVRILCFNGQIERAMELAEESGSKSACYHLARRLSMETEDVQKAIHFYTKAQCYTPALQLAKENGLDNELMHLALLSSQEDMIDAAKYYEENPETLDKAIMLYHKSGELSRALELCFQHRQFEVLHQIADDLSEDSSSEMTKRVAEYFMEHGQFDKAVELLVKSKQFHEALDLCMNHNITLTEDMVERMSIPKKPHETQAETERRVQLSERLGDCCAEQGSYHLATKKYTQSGNKTKAMKVLLKSGDTEKIVFFAGVSRQKDIYVMAANYLQSLDWRNNPEVMKNIISFYTKGRAMESLAGFYDACAQVEIDEYQNYSKAVGALNEALKSLSKAKTKNPTALEAKINFLKERVELIKRFAEARSVYENDPVECIKQCQSLLDEPSLDTAVRMGDVYGLMIEHFGQAGSYEQAYSLMEEMRQRLPTVNMAYYVDIRTIESIHSGLGIPLGRGIGAGVTRSEGGDGGDGEESEGEESVGEEVEEGL